ncbi:MAG: helicase-related protein [Planctomycetaceae bacterium]
MHGNKSQNARQQALAAFRTDKVHVLVATDLAARGIDVEGITHVFNFELPHEPESYVHRIGRTGRAGASGIAISLCAPSEKAMLKGIERLIGFRILPDGREPEPLPTTHATTAPDSADRPRRPRPPRGSSSSSSSGDNRGSDAGSRPPRRRRRGPRTSTGEQASPADTSTRPASTRPTAGERKAARNRRRRKACVSGE